MAAMRSLGRGLAVLGVLLPGAAVAHHGWSGYDASKLVVLAGTVTQASYSFPHVMLTLDAEGKAWRVVLAPPSRMGRRGLDADAIQAGDAVTVEGYPSRSDPGEFRAERIQLDGKSFELR
jgi:hypothetical protein